MTIAPDRRTTLTDCTTTPFATNRRDPLRKGCSEEFLITDLADASGTVGAEGNRRNDAAAGTRANYVVGTARPGSEEAPHSDLENHDFP